MKCVKSEMIDIKKTICYKDLQLKREVCHRYI